MKTHNLRFKSPLFLLLSFIFYLLPCAAQTGNDAQWATAGKQAVGTSASLESKVWFTLANGVMTEVYYPDVTVANVHLLQFVVVNPKTKKVETELDDAIHKIESHEVSVSKNVSPFSQIGIYKDYNSPSSLVFKQTNTSKTADWRIEKTYITDPKSNTVLISVNFQSKTPDLEFYVYYDPSLGNSGMHDTGWTEGRFLLSSDGEIASALTCGRCKFSNETNGFLGVNDGLTQLRENGKIVQSVSRAENGNLVQVAKVTSISMGLRPSTNENIAVIGKDGNFKIGSLGNQSSSMIFAIGFGKTTNSALANAQNSLIKGYEQNYREYQEGWTNYLKNLPKIDPKYQAQFNMAAMILKAFEDKTHRGANIASLSIPWGGGVNANEVGSSGYHAVWARDLYQVATAFMALGDKDAANRALDFLFKVQQKTDGSYPQNSWLDGKPIGGSLQMDQVGFPLILAHELGRFDKETYTKHIKPAADFIVKNGPTTQQERWEEKGGYSPSTIAAEIAGLVCAAAIATIYDHLESEK
ncbi:MAG: glycoside hydrolase family 15 protein, partial [Acidobacteriota bacterium]